MAEPRLTGATPQLRHVGLYVFDLEAMTDFYVRMLGLRITDQGISSLGIPIVFLSADRGQHHQLVLATGRQPDSPSTVNQLAFQFGTLSELKVYADFLQGAGIMPSRVLDHGNAWSIYFPDPEGNRIEIYCDSEWYVPQPCGAPLDLAAPEDAIRSATDALARANPRSVPVADWQRQFDEATAR